MARFTQDGLDEQWADPYQNVDPTANTLTGIFSDPTGSGTNLNSVNNPADPIAMTDPGASGRIARGNGSNTNVTNPVNNYTNAPDATGTQTQTTPGDPVAWLQNQLTNYKGNNLEGDIIPQYNQTFNTGPTTGAAYYNINGHNVIGLPNGVGGQYGGYFTDEGGWHFVPRIAPEGGNSGTPLLNSTSGGGTADILSSYLNSIISGLNNRPDPNAALRSSLTNQFSSLMDRYSAPVSASDPIIQANTDAYHGIQQRQLGSYGETLAERAHAEGVPVGAFDAALGNASNAAGQGEAAYTGGLMTNELQARRSALSNLLGQASGYLSTADQQALQDKIATIDAALGSVTAGNNLTLGEGALANQASALGNQATSINNQNQQFYDSLTNSMANNQNSLDSLIYSILYGG